MSIPEETTITLDEDQIINFLFVHISSNVNTFPFHKEGVMLIIENLEKIEEFILDPFELRRNLKSKLPNLFSLLSKKLISILKARKRFFSAKFIDDIMTASQYIDSVILNIKRGRSINPEDREKYLHYSELLKSLAMNTIYDIEEEGTLETDDIFSFEDLHRFNRSSKDRIRKLVEDAISAVNENEFINRKVKAKVTSNLEKALEGLESKSISEVYGNIREAIDILGAIGSIIGGASVLFFQASESLEDSIRVIEEESSKVNTIYVLKNCIADESDAFQKLLAGMDSSKAPALPPSSLPDESKENEGKDEDEDEDDNF